MGCPYARNDCTAPVDYLPAMLWVGLGRAEDSQTSIDCLPVAWANAIGGGVVVDD